MICNITTAVFPLLLLLLYDNISKHVSYMLVYSITANRSYYCDVYCLLLLLLLLYIYIYT